MKKELPTLEQVDNFPLPELLNPRVQKDGGHDPETSEELLREAKRMLYTLCKDSKAGFTFTNCG